MSVHNNLFDSDFDVLVQTQHLPLPDILEAVRQQLLDPWATQQLQTLQQHRVPGLLGAASAAGSPAHSAVLTQQHGDPASNATAESTAHRVLHTRLQQTDTLLSDAALLADLPAGIAQEAELDLQLLMQEDAAPGAVAAAAPMAVSMALLEAAAQACQEAQVGLLPVAA